MTADLPAQLLAIAVDAARAAGEELRARQATVSAVEAKTSATDPVSDADRASERLLVERILAARPQDAFVGEEGAAREGTTGLRWVLDPLDGTVNYLYGFPAWSVSVACEDGGSVPGTALVGVVHDPLHGETFTAVRGRGAWLGERPLRVTDPVALERALVATGFGYDPEHRRAQALTVATVLGHARDVRRGGSAALDLCWLAAGRVDGYYEDSTSHWDWAAGALIAIEAGAVVSTLEGRGGTSGVVAAGPALHDPLRGLVTGSVALDPKPGKDHG